ncbi:MAG: radical SAM protein [Lachnospiraceae bacterium]|nr:radical SAM protein [Lachnospiraceae bacterium]
MICHNCPVNCDIAEGQTGKCHARGVKDGKIVCQNYGRITSLALDPIEKKPLKMYRPGSYILSAGSYGCNMHCMWCQNDSISRGRVEADFLSCEELAGIALDTRSRGNIGLAFTYNEPSVGYEYVLDCSRLLKQNDMCTVMVTNGMLSPERFDTLIPYIDAYNIDLKTGDAKKYESIGGCLDVILRNIRAASDAGRHVELTTLVVPGFNDDADDFSRIVSAVAGIDRSMPLHITRFFPAGSYRDVSPTRPEKLYEFRDIARSKIDNVFLGNI